MFSAAQLSCKFSFKLISRFFQPLWGFRMGFKLFSGCEMSWDFLVRFHACWVIMRCPYIGFAFCWIIVWGDIMFFFRYEISWWDFLFRFPFEIFMFFVYICQRYVWGFGLHHHIWYCLTLLTVCVYYCLTLPWKQP